MRMCLAILPLSVACLTLFLSSVTNGDPLKVMSAPNLLRIGATENIFVECQGCPGDKLNLEISVKNYPTENLKLASTTMTLTKKDNFQAFAEIKIPADTFEDEPGLKQYVSLEAKFSDGTSLKKVVLVSFQSGYIFIQTDKPLYTPDTKVHYRMFAVTPGMKPVKYDDQASIIDIYIVTPHGIVLPEDTVSLKSGIYSGVYQLPEIVSSGVWKVVASFQNNTHHNYSTEFEVKEYVLPSFEVKITTDKNFFHVDDEYLTIDIQATYLFGKQVEGTAFVVFGIFYQNKEKHSLSSSFKRVKVANGHARATLTRQDILKTYGNIEMLVKSSIYVSVSVFTESGSEMVEAEKQGIHIVTSPYTIHLKNTPKYFKPGMFFEVMVFVENPDGSPAADIPILVSQGDNEDVTDKNGFVKVFVLPAENLETLQVVATTDHPQTPDDQEASARLTVLAYNSNIKSYLHIGLDTAEVHLGDRQIITFHLNAPIAKRDLTYLIQSRGQLVKHGHYNTAVLSIPMMLQITKEMLPSFRIIAYYRDRGEVVSDSVWVDVADTCMGSLKLESADLMFEPRQKFNYKITGDPGATVGLVAVDKGVYALNNKHRLTQKKVWDIVEKADTGCTVGGGKNGMNVFYDAGLLFQSVIIGTDDRLEFKCPDSTRTKRSPTILDVRSSLLSEYNNTLQRQCCLDGIVEIPLSYICERRKEYISDGEACSDAFLKCCQKLAKLRTEIKTEGFQLARSENIRTKFPESWLWLEDTLPLCPDGTTNCKTTSLDKMIVLQDSITTWHLTGISLSPTNGICIDDTLKIIARKKFFIDLKLPYSAVVGEQIEIKAVLHNYLRDDITVQVHLKEVADVCSSASKRKMYTETVTVASESELSVPFIIIPMAHGKFPITVKASVGDRQIDDGVEKVLRVVVVSLGKDQTSSCEKFELNVTLTEELVDGEIYTLKIEVLYRDMDKDAGMTILDIGLLTGYNVDTEDLNKLSNGVDRTISKYEMNNLLSERGSLILYLDSVSHTQRQEVAFKIRQTMRVGVLQPAAVSVYEYYNQKDCVKFYHPKRMNGQLLRLCRDDVCKCHEEECSLQKNGEISDDDRIEKACDTDAKIDYVYKVNVESIDDNVPTDIYKMRITTVIKQGSFDTAPLDKLRVFIGYSLCRESLKLATGRSYLIMGTYDNTEKIGENEYQYVLGEKTWIEYWPTEEECQDAEYAPTCDGLDELEFRFIFKPCKQ